MKNWKRILAAVGTAALLASNVGAASQVVFADENPVENIIPEESDEASTEEAEVVTEPEVEPQVEEAETKEVEEPVSEESSNKEEETVPEVEPEKEPEEIVEEPTEEETEEVVEESTELTTEETPVDETTDEQPAEEEPVEEETAQYHESPLTAELDDIKVELTFDDAAEIPADATLSVDKIDSDSEQYEDLYAQAKDELVSEDQTIAYAEFLNIAIKADDESVTPASGVKAAITYNDSITVPAGTKISVVRGEDVLSASVDSAEAEDGVAVSVVTFTLDGNDVYGIVAVQTPSEEELQDRTIEASATDGASVKISGMLPKDATATMEPVTFSDEELRAYFGDDFIDGINTIGLYDISIWNNEEEWEPNDTVSVVISNPVVEPVDKEADEALEATDEENIVVAHLQEDEESGEKTAETLETEVIGEDVAFTTESFSVYAAITYTVDYYYNDLEYHQAGGTTMTLSDLFGKLEIDADAAEATEVTFTNYDLVQVEQIENDWNLVSVAPFNTDEELVVTFSDGSQISILTKDAQYFKYTYSENLKPWSGTYNVVGKYSIFGGGNGLATVTRQQSGNMGTWGGNTSWSSLVGKTVDENGTVTNNGTQTFVTKSDGNITWDGNPVDKAFFSFGYLGRSQNRAKIKVEITGPNDASANFTLDLSQTMNDDRTELGTVEDWCYLTFDATELVKVGGKGMYHVAATVSDFRTTQGGDNILADMGWTIYGVANNPARETDTAVVVYVAEERINSTRSAEGTFTKSIVVNASGKGEAWFSVHGGETKNGNSDRDYLQIKTASGNYYLGSSGYNSIVLTSQNDNTFSYDDIARPNNEQTGSFNFSNRFAFGLGSFEDSTRLGSKEVTGIIKSMAGGNDAFGSMMLLTEISSATGSAKITKSIDMPYGASGAAAETFKFKVTPMTDGAPLPSNGTNVIGENAKTFDLTFDTDEYGSSKETTIGDFTFATTSESSQTYTYTVTEVAGNSNGWSYDNKSYTLEFTVHYSSAAQATVIDKTEWKDSYGNKVDAATFTNTFNPVVKTGVNLGGEGFVSVVVAMDLIIAAYAVYALARRQMVRR